MPRAALSDYVRSSGRLSGATFRFASPAVRAVLLAGGEDFFCNGLHLHEIEETQRRGGSAADAQLRPAVQQELEGAAALLPELLEHRLQPPPLVVQGPRHRFRVRIQFDDRIDIWSAFIDGGDALQVQLRDLACAQLA